MKSISARVTVLVISIFLFNGVIVYSLEADVIEHMMNDVTTDGYDQSTTRVAQDNGTTTPHVHATTTTVHVHPTTTTVHVHPTTTTVHVHPTHDHGDSTTHDHNDSGTGDSHSMTMQMWFYASNEVIILFQGWATNTTWELIGSCVAVLAMAVLYEALRAWREHFHRKNHIKKMNYVTNNGANKIEGNPYLNESGSSSLTIMSTEQSYQEILVSSTHLLQTCLHFVQLFVGYCLMLVFMTYNIYLCLSVCLGGALGYYLFSYYMRHEEAISSCCN